MLKVLILGQNMSFWQGWATKSKPLHRIRSCTHTTAATQYCTGSAYTLYIILYVTLPICSEVLSYIARAYD